MATVESNYALIKTLESQFANLIANSKLPSEMTKTERENLLDSIYPRITNNGVKYRTDKGDNTDYTAFQPGDTIIHIDEVNKISYVGMVIALPLSLPADFNDPAKIDLYNKSEPAL